MVLTVQATEVATRTGKRQTHSARMEVVERLLLDRVDSQRTGFAIDLADEHAIMISATLATPCPTIGDTAMMGTEQTFHHPII